MKHFWVTGVLWSSEPATERAAREAMLTAIYRLAYVQRNGPARTLRDMLAQEAVDNEPVGIAVVADHHHSQVLGEQRRALAVEELGRTHQADAPPQ